MYFLHCANVVLLISITLLLIHCCENSERVPVRILLKDGNSSTPWRLDAYKKLNAPEGSRIRRSTTGEEDRTVRITINGADVMLNLLLHPKRHHPVTKDTIVEWVAENGERTISRGINTDHCWYSGWVENMTDSQVSIGICDGLSGVIHVHNKTLLLEPEFGDSNEELVHVIYPLGLGNLSLKSDQHYGQFPMRKKRSAILLNNLQIDYDEEGNEIVDTVHQEEYDQKEDEEEEDESNSIDEEDDEALIMDTYSEIDDYDIHPPPSVIEATSLEEAEKKSGNDTTRTSAVDSNDVIDGYSVDKLWEGEPQAAKKKKSESKSIVGDDPIKYLEMALAIDHTVIKFHGKTRVRQYVLTLLNIVSAIYEDTSLESNMRLVVTRLVFYEDRKHGQVRESNSKRSLENVNAWNAGLIRNAASEAPHDIAVWLTRYDLGGPSGYAPVAGVCDPDRSCSLNRDEGLTSAFIIAHEVGHVLGFSHDGDLSAGNDCSDEALQGSVMAPMVAATFSRFHWSRCTHWEYHFKQHNWKCLKNQPKVDNSTTAVNSSTHHSYTLDEQCRMEFGDGYFLCRSFALTDPCTHLWCGHKSSPQLCKTKKGPPLEGTPCGKDKWCIKGFCEPIGKRKKLVGPVAKNPRNGNWSEWSDWNTCSRTCNVGVRFRTRKCNKPKPANGGKICQGLSEESQLCNSQPCPQWTDFRAEQCATIPALLMKGNISALSWVPWEQTNQSLLCRLTCVSLETGEIFQSTDNVIDGTFCSYENPHSVCIQGQCKTIGCDKRLDSVAKENECGVCHGKAGDCTAASRHYSGAPRPPHRRVVVIPRGARNIRIKEEPNTSNRLALKGRGTREWILNGTFPIRQDIFTHYFIASGTRFTYNSIFGLETMRARGPLLADVTLMIVPPITGKRQSANVTVTWNTPPKSHRRKNPGPDGGIVEKEVFWELAGWSLCSRSCGEGTQTQIWYCRDRQTDQVLRRKHCSHLDEPQILTRLCNTFSCDYRWVTGPWEGCSQTCGNDGVQMRMIYCVRTAMVKSNADSYKLPTAANGTSHEARRVPEVTDDGDLSSEVDKISNPVAADSWRPTIKDLKKQLAVENEVLTWKPNAITDPALCRDQIPSETQPCNRVPCPGMWIEKTWTNCSTTCGQGLQEMQFICVSQSKALTGLAKELVAFTDPSIVEEDDEERSFAFSQRKTGTTITSTSSRNQWKNFVCGLKPQLSRPCSGPECQYPSNDLKLACSDGSDRCQLPILQRYCILPQFKVLCCKSCANYLSQ